jgi:hypothetical protein
MPARCKVTERSRCFLDGTDGSWSILRFCPSGRHAGQPLAKNHTACAVELLLTSSFDDLECRDLLDGGRVKYHYRQGALNLGLQSVAPKTDVRPGTERAKSWPTACRSFKGIGSYRGIPHSRHRSDLPPIILRNFIESSILTRVFRQGATECLGEFHIRRAFAFGRRSFEASPSQQG